MTDALTKLLIAKGIITDKEFKARWEPNERTTLLC